MNLITLVENTPGAEHCIHEHGLSIYIETQKHKILLDTGATDAFMKNAEILGIDLTQVDTVVLSHGHYDHAGGLMDFVEVNHKAAIYMRPTAGKAYYHVYADGAKYIGMDSRIRKLPQVIYTREHEILDEEITLFSGVQGRRLWPRGNQSLKVLTEGGFEPDRFEQDRFVKNGFEQDAKECFAQNIFEQDCFDHEQALVIREQGESILISGCAHNGILNILDRYWELYGTWPDRVITGFHMKKSIPFTAEDKEVAVATAEALKQIGDTIFYSGHCTGEEAFAIMKEILGERLQALHSGEVIYNRGTDR